MDGSKKRQERDFDDKPEEKKYSRPPSDGTNYLNNSAIKQSLNAYLSSGNQEIGAKMATTSKGMDKIDLRMPDSTLPAPQPLLTQYRIGRNEVITRNIQELQSRLAADLAPNEGSSDVLETQIRTNYMFNRVFQINYEEPDDPEERNEVSSRLEDWLAYFGLISRGNELEYLLFNTMGDGRHVNAALEDYLAHTPNVEDPDALELIKQNYYKAILLTLQAKNLPNIPELIPEPAAAKGGKRTLKRKKMRTKKNRRSKSKRHLTKNKKRKTKKR
jgi:hypothetical protein